MQQMVNTLAGSLTKPQWKIEQENDSEIGPVVSLVKKNGHLQYKVKKEDNAGSKVLLRFSDNLRLIDGLFYKKWVYKDQITYLQFVLPISFRKRMVMACYDQFGHLGMDKTLVLLQERFFWPKINKDVRTHIRNCDHCLRFKQAPEQAPMETIETTYPLELIHVDNR